MCKSCPELFIPESTFQKDSDVNKAKRYKAKARQNKAKEWGGNAKAKVIASGCKAKDLGFKAKAKNVGFKAMAKA